MAETKVYDITAAAEKGEVAIVIEGEADLGKGWRLNELAQAWI